MNGKFIKNIPTGEVFRLKDLVLYSEGKVISKTIVKRDDLNVTLFSFDENEGLSTHKSTGDAMVYVLEGCVEITIGQDSHLILSEGQTAVLPSNIPHALKALSKFKMLLTVIKPTTKGFDTKWIVANQLEVLELARFMA